MAYYADKTLLLADLFGTEAIVVADDSITVADRRYPIVDDVIVLLPQAKLPSALRRRVPAEERPHDVEFAADIQSTFGAEWQTYPEILPEHAEEFAAYFDVVDLDGLKGKRICDFGCGIGRWSYFLRDSASELILIDFSEAIFVARHNLRDCKSAVFFMGDLTALPFRTDFCDFGFSLGVLHHLATDALTEVRRLARYAPQLLIYLYSALDDRPAHYRMLLPIVSALRNVFSKVENTTVRHAITELLTWLIYMPFIGLGWLMKPLGLHTRVPLFDFYHDKSMKRIRQDVYDRFFTRIEQRVSRTQIDSLKDTFSEVIISSRIPMWHFLCRR